MNWNFGSFKSPMVDNNKKYSNRLNQVIKLHHIWSIFTINCDSFVSKFEKWSKNDNFWLFWASYEPLCWPMKTFIPINSVRWLGYIMLNLFFSCNAEIFKANVKNDPKVAIIGHFGPFTPFTGPFGGWKKNIF